MKLDVYIIQWRFEGEIEDIVVVKEIDEGYLRNSLNFLLFL